MLASQQSATVKDSARKLKVMVVDDSVVVRGLVSRWVSEDPQMTVVGSIRNGKLAVDEVAALNPDVIILDIEMPEMDGLTALPLLLRARPGVVVIMASTLTRRNAEISLKALSLGAKDYVPKPESNSGVTTSAEFKRELIEKIRALGGRVAGISFGGSGQMSPRAPLATPGSAVQRPAGAVDAGPATVTRGGATINFRPYSRAIPRILAVGSSTGGPQALIEVFKTIGPALGNIPTVITQHMPATFTTILASHIEKASGRPCREGEDGETLQPGHIYVAPGGRHMVLAGKGGQTTIRLTDGPAINFCKPAVDPLFESVAEIYGSAALAVVLTGMGHDGARGGEAIAMKGGTLLAQDEATSVVWGMPGAAAMTGCCSALLPLNEIGGKLINLFGGKTS